VGHVANLQAGRFPFCFDNSGTASGCVAVRFNRMVSWEKAKEIHWMRRHVIDSLPGDRVKSTQSTRPPGAPDHPAHPTNQCGRLSEFKYARRNACAKTLRKRSGVQFY